MTLRPGWLERQIKDTNDDIATWPAWMRREAGFMTEKKVRCDACGQPAVELRYDFDRVRDAADGLDTEYKTVDLCAKHLQERLQIFLQEPPKAPTECGKQAFSKWVQGLGWKP